MKPQKSQQRGQALRLHIFGFSYLRARDLSLKNIPARLQRLRDRESGEFTLVYSCGKCNFPPLRKNKNFCHAKLLLPINSKGLGET